MTIVKTTLTPGANARARLTANKIMLASVRRAEVEKAQPEPVLRTPAQRQEIWVAQAIARRPLR